MWEYNYTPNSYELYHYGVPGMKWGQRRYKARQIKYAAKIKKADAKSKSSKTGVGKRYNMLKAANYRTKADISKNVHNAKGLYTKLYARNDNRAHAIASANLSKAYAQMKGTVKSDRKKRSYDAMSKNSENISKYWKKTNSAAAGTMLDKNLRNMKVQTVSGRTTTYGKRYLDTVLTGGTVGAAKDLKYRANARKKNKNK